ncbi:MAG: BlaI/MecI/CopY family transcriptional regulator [Acidobacteriota bacterium]
MSSQKGNGTSQEDHEGRQEPAVKISEAEWEVMTLLWEDAPQTSFRIVEQLRESTEWSPKTIKTLLSRLVKKGFLSFEKEANRYLYFPLVSRRDSIRRESRSFLDRIFQGDAASMLLHFVQDGALSDDERHHLRSMLDRMDEQADSGEDDR